MYDKLGYSHDHIVKLGCSPSQGASGPGGAAAKEADPKAKIMAGVGVRAEVHGPGHTALPAHHHGHGDGSGGDELHKEALCSGDRWSVAWSCPALVPGRL